jgi:hypothetical protein
VNTGKRTSRDKAKTGEEVKTVRLTVDVDEAMWRELRTAAEEDRSEQGRASVAAIVKRLLTEYLAQRKRKGGR